MAGLRGKYAAKCFTYCLHVGYAVSVSLCGLFLLVRMLFNDLVSERNLSTAMGQKDDAHH